MRRLRELEAAHPEAVTPDSPSQKVGGHRSEKFAPVEHAVPLESLNDVFSYEELEDFGRRMESALGPGVRYVVEPKVDGLSMALEYRDGKFWAGGDPGRRGDGGGCDGKPAHAAQHSRRLGARPGADYRPWGGIHGAGCVPGTEPPAGDPGGDSVGQPRNAAAGSMRQLDPQVTRDRQLDIILFNVQLSSGEVPSSHAESLDYLQSLGFSVVPRWVFYSIEDCCRQDTDPWGRAGQTAL